MQNVTTLGVMNSRENQDILSAEGDPRQDLGGVTLQSRDLKGPLAHRGFRTDTPVRQIGSRRFLDSA